MSLSVNEKKILDYIRQGRNTLADFTDNLMIPAPKANILAEQLEQSGYIVRAGYVGAERFNWLLTDKGVDELDPLPENDFKLINEAGINMNQLKILTYTKDNPNVLAGQICDNMGLCGNEMVSDLCFLVDHSFLNEGGLIRRKFTITEKGSEIAKKYADLLKA